MLRRLKARLDARRNRHEAKRTEDGVRVFTAILGTCAICGQEVNGHSYAQLASVISSRTPNLVERFKDAITRRDWRCLSELQEWEGQEDEFVLLAICCPREDHLSLKELRDLFGLYASSHVLQDIMLSPGEQLTVRELVGNSWRPLAPAAN